MVLLFRRLVHFFNVQEKIGDFLAGVLTRVPPTTDATPAVAGQQKMAVKRRKVNRFHCFYYSYRTPTESYIVTNSLSSKLGDQVVQARD